MLKKLTLNLLTLTVFILTMLISTHIVLADEACSPNSCAGSNAALRVDSCVFNTSACGNGSTTDSVPFSCPTGGSSGSCTGWAEGVNGCTGNTPVIVSTGCYCSTPGYNGDCASSGNGDSCGPSVYGGTCNTCNTIVTCGSPQGGYRSCCGSTSTTTTPPEEWCGDGNCQDSNNENCSSCETDCGACNSGGGSPEYCGDGICNNGETSCSCGIDNCTGTCNTPACSVSLTPSTVDMYTDDNPFDITANVSGIQNGNVSQVEFSKSNNNLSMSPVFDTNGIPYESQITPSSAGSTTLTANVFMGDNNVRCSAAATINITTPPLFTTGEAPDCEAFDVTASSVTVGEGANWEVTITDEGDNIIPDGGFEGGSSTTSTYWAGTHQLNEFTAFLDSSFAGEGSGFLKVSRENPSTALNHDPHGVSTYFESGDSNVINKTYTLKFLGKTHQGSNRVGLILIQTDLGGSSWLSPAPIFTNEWNEYSYDLTVNTGTLSPTSKLRVVLRPPDNFSNSFNYWPVYYDSIKLYKTSTAQVDDDTVEFYYRLASTTGCTGWIAANNSSGSNIGTRIGSTDTFDFTWDTSSIPAGDYTIAVNAADDEINWMTGNPAGSCGTSLTARPACNATQTVTACTASCGGSSCGNTDQTPNLVSNIIVSGVSGISGNNLNLSNNSLPRTISWTAASVPAPGSLTNYNVWLVPRGSTPGTCTGTCRNLGTTTGTSISLPSVLAAQTNNFDIRIRANNGCGTPGDWVTRQVNLTANVSGAIYESSITQSGGLNNCSGNGGGPQLNISNANPEITGSNGGNLTIEPGDAYRLSDVPYAPDNNWSDYGFRVTLKLNNPDPEESFFCNCPQDGDPFECSQADTTSPASSQNFFVSALNLSNGPWWQSSEGNAYGATGYNNPISEACDDSIACDANIIIQNADGDSKSAGIPMSGGNISGTSYYTAYNNGGTPPITQPRSENTKHTNLVQEDYNYFVRSIDLSSVQKITASTITSVPTNGTDYDDTKVLHRNGNLTLNFDKQTLTSDTKVIIFVDGNVTIQNSGSPGDQVLDVEDGSYFSIIASENITFANNIGNVCAYPTCGSTTNIDGVYVATGDLIIADDGDGAAPDNMFIGEGTFVGWGGIKLYRSFDNTGSSFDRALNNEYPTQLFKFRPDFNENTPEVLKHPSLVWQEVN
jgi:hypothetical protein